MATARARHILVDSKAKCLELKRQIEAGTDFAEVARNNSSCPSRAKGGDLGVFSEGQMVPEFDKAVFKGKVGDLVGPVKTEFGYHLIKITEKS
ncbi:MAG: peptidylprolyl isomerase [Epsilonproteobacteria bacterium]|nr:MAG: peptidylprolyl isomerase [Campylobacterota bacterium]